MHISGIRPVKPDRQILNPTYPRRDKKNEGDFKDLLETEIKKMEPQKPSKAMIPSPKIIYASGVDQ